MEVADFWQYEFEAKRERDQQEQVQAALIRVRTLLNHQYVRDIVGQLKTTVDFSQIMQKKQILLIKLSASLAPDIKKFIGTILISELLHATRERPVDQRSQFCIFVDEFQNFVTDDFATLINEGRKFGVATTIAHQERYGQLLENRKVLGATAATANKVLFQVTHEDAKEFAPEFAMSPPDPTDNLVIAQDPLTVLLKRGHHNPAISEFIHEFLQPIMNNIEQYKGVVSSTSFYKMQHDSLATQYKDLASMSQIDARIGGSIPQPRRQYASIQGALTEAQDAIRKAMQAHNLSQEKTNDLISFQDVLNKHTSQRNRSVPHAMGWKNGTGSSIL
jgi:hypothetical protein